MSALLGLQAHLLERGINSTPLSDALSVEPPFICLFIHVFPMEFAWYNPDIFFDTDRLVFRPFGWKIHLLDHQIIEKFDAIIDEFAIVRAEAEDKPDYDTYKRIISRCAKIVDSWEVDN